MSKKLLLVLIFSVIAGLCQAQTPDADAKPAAEPAAAPEQAVAGEKPAEPADPSVAKDLAKATDTSSEVGETLEAVRDTVAEQPVSATNNDKVLFNPKTHRDPTLSPDDFLLLDYREKQRLAAIEAERQRQLAEERRKQEEAERQRQLELARIKDPTREVRGLINIGGIVGKEVFIGDKVFTIGNRVHGARIEAVTPDSVVFSYKGHKFVKKMK